MSNKFCTICKMDKDTVSLTHSDNRVKHLLTCGHKLIEISLNDSIKISREIELRKIGKTSEKFRQGDKPLNINYSRKLIEWGDRDYEAARILFSVQDKNYDFMSQAAFLCAQAVEKYFKAYLFWNTQQHYHVLSGTQVLNQFRKLNHDLIKILNECKKNNCSFDDFKTQVQVINRYSLLKYPDIEDKIVYSEKGLSISSGILKEVKKIGDFIKRLIQDK